MKNENDRFYEYLINKHKEKQVVVAIEELSELQKELCKYLRKGEATNEAEIIEEIADCFIMLNQMVKYFKIEEKEIFEKIQTKVARQIKREGYKESEAM